jgi:hypothetical protein
MPVSDMPDMQAHQARAMLHIASPKQTEFCTPCLQKKSAKPKQSQMLGWLTGKGVAPHCCDWCSVQEKKFQVSTLLPFIDL